MYGLREWLAILVSAALALTGFLLHERVPAAFFCVCTIVCVFGPFLERRRRSNESLAIDEAGIARAGKGVREFVGWNEIERVRILTNDRGPHAEDVFFVIDSDHDTGCVVSHDLAVRAKLLDALQARLPGLDNAAVIEAMTCSENREFTIWRRSA